MAADSHILVAHMMALYLLEAAQCRYQLAHKMVNFPMDLEHLSQFQHLSGFLLVLFPLELRRCQQARISAGSLLPLPPVFPSLQLLAEASFRWSHRLPVFLSPVP